MKEQILYLSEEEIKKIKESSKDDEKFFRVSESETSEKKEEQ